MGPWVWAFVAPAWAETAIVCSSSPPPGEECDFTSLTTALLLGPDTLELTEGEHLGSVIVTGSRTIKGRGPATRVVARAAMLGLPVFELAGTEALRLQDLEIDGRGFAPGIWVLGGSGVELKSLTVRDAVTSVVGGGDGYGGAVSVLGQAEVTLDGVALLDSIGDWGGGLSVGDHSVVVVTDGQITGCSAVRGGAVAVGGAGSLTLDGTVIGTSFAEELGGLVYVSDGTATLTRATLADGVALGSGPAAMVEGFGTLRLSETTVLGGTLGGPLDGAAQEWSLHAAGGASLTVEDSRVEGAGAGGIGGVFASEIVVRRSAVVDTAGGWGGGIAAFQSGSLVVEDSWVCGSTAERGAGIDLWESCDPGPCTVSHTVVQGTSADVFGGAVKVFDVVRPVTLDHLTLVGNAAPEGGAVYLSGSPEVTLTRSLVVDHTGGVAVQAAVAPTADWNGFGGNVGGDTNFTLSPTNRVGLAPVFVAGPGLCGEDVHLADLPENGWLLDHDVGAFPGECTSCADADADGFPAYEDCDDGDAARHPGAEELAADGVDQDCDGRERCFEDADLDGWGTPMEVDSDALDCRFEGVAPVDGDCGPTDPSIHPDAPDPLGDGVDANCDGIDGFDGDGDGVPVEQDCDDTSAAVGDCVQAVAGGGGCGCDAGGGPAGGAWLVALAGLGLRWRRRA